VVRPDKDGVEEDVNENKGKGKTQLSTHEPLDYALKTLRMHVIRCLGGGGGWTGGGHKGKRRILSHEDQTVSACTCRFNWHVPILLYEEEVRLKTNHGDAFYRVAANTRPWALLNLGTDLQI